MPFRLSYLRRLLNDERARGKNLSNKVLFQEHPKTLKKRFKLTSRTYGPHVTYLKQRGDKECAYKKYEVSSAMVKETMYFNYDKNKYLLDS